MNAIAKDDHGKQNAAGWVSSIGEMLAALNCDYDRLEELRDQCDESAAHAAGCAMHAHGAAECTCGKADDLAELAELEAARTISGSIMKDADEAREHIEQSPLCIEVRSGWHTVGDQDAGEPEEFRILLTTGGPALQIRGELDEHREPHRAWLEYQDWGTPWTQYFDVEQDTLLEFCRVFYFGE